MIPDSLDFILRPTNDEQAEYAAAAQSWCVLPEPQRRVVLDERASVFVSHDDGRMCGYYREIGKWSFGGFQECLREHPTMAQVMASAPGDELPAASSPAAGRNSEGAVRKGSQAASSGQTPAAGLVAGPPTTAPRPQVSAPASPTVPLGEAGPHSSDADAVGAPASGVAADDLAELLQKVEITHPRIAKQVAAVPSGCWEWQGYTNSIGRPMINIDRVPRLVYRIVYEIATGVAPGDLHVCHHCDNPICTRPSHLFLGTDLDNNRDMWAKGRAVPPPTHWGEKHPLVHASDSAVRMAREAFAGGESAESIARRMGHAAATVRGWIRGKTRLAAGGPTLGT